MRLICIVVILILLIGTASAVPAVTTAPIVKVVVQPNSSQTVFLDEIAFMGLQLDAVVVNMYLFTGWDIDGKKEMAEVSKQAIAQLDLLKEEVSKLQPPNELASLKQIFLKYAEAIKGLFKDINKKNIQKADKDLVDILDQYSNECAGFAKTLDFSLRNKSFEGGDQPGPVFEKKDQDVAYRQGMELMGQKEFERAYKIFADLKKNVVPNSVVYDYVLLAISDLIGKSNYTTDENGELKDFPEDQIIKNADWIFAKEYSPLFLEFFVRWRTITQEMDHGMSNWSSIPNWEYNLKRKKLIKKITAHADKNPADAWARLQCRRLIDLDNIQRGTLYGNDNIHYIGRLYMDLKDKSSVKDLEEKEKS